MAKGHCILGGTYTYVHAGHEKMLAKCNNFSEITIGLTSDSFVKRHKIYPSFPYERRLAGLKSALRRRKLFSRARINTIDDEAGGADKNKEADTIIVSEETYAAALRINAKRRARGLKPLRIISIPIVYGENLKKISCSEIYERKTDLSGKLRKPLAVQTATDNPTKLAGTARALTLLFGKKFMLAGHAEHSSVPDHPFDSETFTGARNRARAVWKRANKNKKSICDYSLGIESGLFRFQKGLHIDITVCCVYDGKKETYGTGMGFVVPDWIAKKIRANGSDLTKVLAEVAGVRNIGRKQGAIGWFSGGKIHRAEQIEAAVKCAFVPRVAVAKLGMEY